MDALGAAFSVIGTTDLLDGFIQAPDDGWSTGAIMAAFTIGVAGLATFVVVWKRRWPDPH